MDDKILQLIYSLFDFYDCHPDFISDVRDLIIGSGNEKTFYNLFYKNTEFLKELGENCIQHSNFEILKKSSGLFSMKLKNKTMNIRILFTRKSDKLALLLCSFYERSDSNDTYEKNIPIAEKRQKEMEERNGR